MDAGAPRSDPPPAPGGPWAPFALAVVVLVLAVTSQYFVPAAWPASRRVYGSFVGDLLIVYGIPIVAFALLVGVGPLRHWRANLGEATAQGLGWYGAMGLLALLVFIVSAAVYLAVDPGALKLLERTNPALEAARGDPWFFVGFAFVVGAIEETIFRGWVFGYWASRVRGWVTPAILSSALFAALHLYYGTTYGLAAPLIFPMLFLLGFAFAASYRSSGGNLVVPAALHGSYDAASYLTLISVSAGLAVRYGSILLGALVGLLYYLNRLPPSEDAPSLPP